MFVNIECTTEEERWIRFNGIFWDFKYFLVSCNFSGMSTYEWMRNRKVMCNKANKHTELYQISLSIKGTSNLLTLSERFHFIRNVTINPSNSLNFLTQSQRHPTLWWYKHQEKESYSLSNILVIKNPIKSNKMLIEITILN